MCSSLNQFGEGLPEGQESREKCLQELKDKDPESEHMCVCVYMYIHIYIYIYIYIYTRIVYSHVTAVAMWQDLAMDGWEEGGSKESESDQLWKPGRLLEASVHPCYHLRPLLKAACPNRPGSLSRQCGRV